MKRYDEKILNSLLDTYESSLLYTGQNQRKQSIAFSVKRSTLPEYFDETSMQFELVHAQLAEAEQKGFVRLIWQKGKAGHILEKCLLQTGHVDEIYAYLQRRTRKQKEEDVLSVCREYRGRHPVLDAFLQYVEQRIGQGMSVAQYVDRDHPQELAERCGLIGHILENQKEIFLREFSVQYLKDSKAAEKEIVGAAGIIARFYPGAALTELTAEQVLEEFNIFKNPSWVMVKGSGAFMLPPKGAGGQDAADMSGCHICLDTLKGGIGLSSQDIGAICWDDNRQVRQIVTIENLTSFHRWQEEDTLAIYLGGYHNRMKRQFLQELYRVFPNCKYSHFGDLDCGGFKIWKDLCRKTGIPFKTRYMDRGTYLQYCKNGKDLTEHDCKELQRMMEEPFFEGQRKLFETMLEVGKKVEQEGVKIDTF